MQAHPRYTIGVAILLLLVAAFYTLGVWIGARRGAPDRRQGVRTGLGITLSWIAFFAFARTFFGILFLAVGAGLLILPLLVAYTGYGLGLFYAARPSRGRAVAAAVFPFVAVGMLMALDALRDAVVDWRQRAVVKPAAQIVLDGTPMTLAVTPRTLIEGEDGRWYGYGDRAPEGLRARAVVIIHPSTGCDTLDKLGVDAPCPEAAFKRMGRVMERWCASPYAAPASDVACPHSQPHITRIAAEVTPSPALASGTPVEVNGSRASEVVCNPLVRAPGPAVITGDNVDRSFLEQARCVGIHDLKGPDGQPLVATTLYDPRGDYTDGYLLRDVARLWEVATRE